MDAFFYSRHNNEHGLSAREIFSLSEAVQRQFSPLYFSRMSSPDHLIRLSAHDLLEISEEINRFYTPGCFDQTKTECVLMPVDTEHLHVYWRMDERRQSIDEAVDKGEEALVIRIYAEGTQQTADPERKHFFDLHHHERIGQKSVELPKSFTENYFSAAIGHCVGDDEFVTLARSDQVMVPRSGQGNIEEQKDDGLKGGDPCFCSQNFSGKGTLNQ